MLIFLIGEGSAMRGQWIQIASIGFALKSYLCAALQAQDEIIGPCACLSLPANATSSEVVFYFFTRTRQENQCDISCTNSSGYSLI